MGALTRKEKVDKILRENTGKWMTAKQILARIGNRWSVSGFSSSASLGLFLRRYKFKKDDIKYYISEEKVEQSKYGPYGNIDTREEKYK